MAAPAFPLPEKHLPLLLPCTRSEGAPVCQLSEHITEYNEVLWNVGLEIREEEGGVGEFVIASPPGIRLTGLWLEEQNEREILAVGLFNDVIAQHPCIVSIELNFALAINPLILNILRNKCSVRKLIISYIPCIPCWEANVVEVLKKLAIPRIKYDAVSTPKYTSLDNIALYEAPMRQSQTFLTTLDVGALKINSGFVQVLSAVLEQNNTISELIVGASVFTSESLVHDSFAAYLGKKGSALKMLTVITPLVPARGLQSLATAVKEARTLEKLVVHTDIYSIYCAEQNALFADVITQSCALRDLKVMCPRRRAFPPMPDQFNIVLGDPAARIDPWVSALQRNTTLSALALDLVGLSNDECCTFFRALALNNALKDIHINYLPACADIRDICDIIRQSRLAKTAHIEDYVVSARSLPVLPECPELASLTISYLSPNDRETFCRTLQVLATCRHVVSLRVCVERRLLTLTQASMAAYIAEARTLQTITVVVYANLFDRGQHHQQDPFADGPLAEALASNAGLVRIEVKDLALSEERSGLLAKALIDSKTLTELAFVARSCESNDAFLRSLAAGIERNYSLLHIDVPMYKWRYAEVRVIRNIAVRNASLVARAARFVMGDHSDYNAHAVELVSRHASVLSAVQKSAGVEVDQAKAMIRRALRLHCLTGLDEYMRLTGVVKRRVECVGRPGDTLQLDELDYECWLHIRQFLIVADVVQSDCPFKL